MSASDESYIDKIQEDTAGLIIGDRALQFREQFAYRYDLATAWREMTGLPFVFAVWVSVREMEEVWIRPFNMNQQIGLQRFDALITKESDNQIKYDLSRYFQSNLSYMLDEYKYSAIQSFLSKMTDTSLFNSYSSSIVNPV